jgi:hypothetical protein
VNFDFYFLLRLIENPAGVETSYSFRNPASFISTN